MKTEDISGWWIVKPEENLKEGCELKCPECGEWANHNNWDESEVGCEDCGEHMAIKCPNCDERFDHVWSPTFECRLV